jgi:hypothetical protein
MSHLPNSLAGRLTSLTERRSIVRHALDRASSVRSYDQDGRLRVASAVLTRACVSPYLGSEIPDYDVLGLNPQATYALLRPVEELRKALAGFNGLPVMSRHIPVSADDHQPGLVIGSTGSDAKIVGDTLTNSLVIWAQSGIDMIESGQARSLSCGYRYTPVMQSGQYMGVFYQGFMKDLIPNHLAVVDEPRVMGAMVGDAAIPNSQTTETDDMDIEKLMNFLSGKLSQEDLIAVGKMLAGNDDDDLVAGADDMPDTGIQRPNGPLQAADRRRTSLPSFDQMFPNAVRLKSSF